MQTDVSIRRAGPGDEQALAMVGQATFLETFAGILDGTAIIAHCRNAHSSELYERWIADPRYALWLAEASPGSAPIGYAVMAPPDLPAANPESDLELKRIYLMGRYQGSGTGKKILQLAVAHAKAAAAARVLLGVYAGNESAISFYGKSGFVKLAERRFDVGGRSYDDHVLALSLAV